MKDAFPHAISDVEWAVLPQFLTLLCRPHSPWKSSISLPPTSYLPDALMQFQTAREAGKCRLPLLPGGARLMMNV